MKCGHVTIANKMRERDARAQQNGIARGRCCDMIDFELFSSVSHLCA